MIQSMTLADKKTVDNIKDLVNQIYAEITNTSLKKRYGIKIDKNNSDPNTRVEYIYDAKDFTPASLKNDVFDYGSWKDIWFVKNNIPVVLGFDGKEKYKLDPNDYSKKIDGSDSNINSMDCDGNAMSKIPLVWVSFTEDESYQYISVSPIKYDESYNALAYTDDNNNIVDNIYLAMFEGYIDDKNRLRSLLDFEPSTGRTISSYKNSAKANGDKWKIRNIYQRQLINALLMIIGKTTDSQSVFGNGIVMNDTSHFINTGNIHGKQFNGKSSVYDSAINIFHMENWWGNTSEFLDKIIMKYGSYKIDDKNVNIDLDKSSSYVGFIGKSVCTDFGVFPSDLNGSSSTFLADGFSYNPDIEATGIVGGAVNDSSLCGMNCISFILEKNNVSDFVGASLSYL